MSRRRLVRAALVGLLAVALTAATAIGSTGIGRAKNRSGFSLSGHVTGLLPGQQKRLVIVVHNFGGRAIRVRVITTHVRDASSVCKARNLKVESFHGDLRVRAHRSRRAVVTASMRVDSPSACQGAVFRLSFHGRAARG
jgi:hypothetical protein